MLSHPAKRKNIKYVREPEMVCKCIEVEDVQFQFTQVGKSKACF